MLLISSDADIWRALLIQVQSCQYSDASLLELAELVDSAGIYVAGTLTATRRRYDPKFFIGSGKVAEMSRQASAVNANIIIFNHALSPAQERNLERQTHIRVIDRTRLILDIFAQRARTYEGKLQVELAQLKHLSTRLIRGWTHLERQKGGIGLRGPGETQLETDRRLIGKRIQSIHRRLDRVCTQRSLSRQQRQKNATPVISLIGYTNAGKSTLFNCLTGANVMSADQPFVTLDPTIRTMQINTGRDVILTDTVGFIRDLPPDLIKSFRATLEEVRQADLLLHVIDVNQDQRQQKMLEVKQTVAFIHASSIPQIEVYNKIDKYDKLCGKVVYPEKGPFARVWLSSLSGAGVAYLVSAIRQFFTKKACFHRLNLPVTAGQLRAKLFALGAVKHEDIQEDGSWLLDVELEDNRLHRLCHASNLDLRKVKITSCSR